VLPQQPGQFTGISDLAILKRGHCFSEFIVLIAGILGVNIRKS
jgi:hypothetical protein